MSEAADDIEEQVAADVEAGVQSFSDGTNSVTAMDPQKRLDVVDRLRRQDATGQDWFGLRTKTLRGGGAW